MSVSWPWGQAPFWLDSSALVCSALHQSFPLFSLDIFDVSSSMFQLQTLRWIFSPIYDEHKTLFKNCYRNSPIIQRVNIFGFPGLCCLLQLFNSTIRNKAPFDNMQINGHGCVPTKQKLFVWKPLVGQIWIAVCLLFLEYNKYVSLRT